MTRYIRFVVCVIATLCTVVAFAQVAFTQIDATIQDSTGSSPVAYVYVSSSPGSNNYEISAFAAASNGKLRAVPGSPFPADVQYMAVNGKYLFGTNGIYIYSFSIAPDGALKQV